MEYLRFYSWINNEGKATLITFTEILSAIQKLTRCRRKFIKAR